MERKKYLLVAMLLFISLWASAFSNKTIYQSFITGNMKSWKTEIDRLQKNSAKSNEQRLELINYQIGYIGWCVGEERYDEAEKYIELADEHLEFLEEKNYKPSYIAAFIGMLDGLKIGVNNFYAPFLGPGILSDAEDAMEIDKQNPYAYILWGNSKYYMWAMMGGSKETAMEYYKKAETLFVSKKQNANNWNYLSILTMIAYANVQMGLYTEADTYYKKILKIEPNYTWIKNEIYPKFKEEYGTK